MAKLLVGLAIMLMFTSVNCYWWNLGEDPISDDDPIGSDDPFPGTLVTVTPAIENPMRIYHLIEQADVLIMESFPPQLSLVVTGYQPDGCVAPVIIEKIVEDTTIAVNIYRELPQDAVCTALAVRYEENIALGSFDIGKTYTVIVNGYEIEVKL